MVFLCHKVHLVPEAIIQAVPSSKLKLLAASLRDGYIHLPFAKHQLHMTQPVPQVGEKEQPCEVPGAETKRDG